MFRAVGTVIVLWYLSSLFSSSFEALDQALTATFETVEIAAVLSKLELK